MSRNIAVPKKYEGKPRARGAVERINNERKQKIVPTIMNIPDII
ncbi:MAG: hypothetical protein VX693_09135 [Pseudomonadota bacterium]|nr:hypothetical protein [Pseudomonadota bacterium]